MDDINLKLWNHSVEEVVEIATELYVALKTLRDLNAQASGSGYTDPDVLEKLYAANSVASAALRKARGEVS